MEILSKDKDIKHLKFLCVYHMDDLIQLWQVG